MSDLAVIALLLAGFIIEALCVVGLLVTKDVFDRLHFTGPAAIGAAAIALAVVVDEGLSVRGVKALVVAVLILVTSPVLTHVTARAARVRQFGHWVAMPDEKVERT